MSRTFLLESQLARRMFNLDKYFTLQTEEINAGLYMLIVKSPFFPEKNLTILFKINVLVATMNSQTLLIAGSCSGGILALILATSVVFSVWTRGKKNGKGKLLH